jgi:hypothetical protein
MEFPGALSFLDDIVMHAASSHGAARSCCWSAVKHEIAQLYFECKVLYLARYSQKAAVNRNSIRLRAAYRSMVQCCARKYHFTAACSNITITLHLKCRKASHSR